LKRLLLVVLHSMIHRDVVVNEIMLTQAPREAFWGQETISVQVLNSHSYTLILQGEKDNFSETAMSLRA
jgi:hypothetical protein